jgi:hypothetical protein
VIWNGAEIGRQEDSMKGVVASVPHYPVRKREKGRRIV